MMAEKLLFELVAPQRLLFSEEVDMVVVPGAAGYFGALPRHSPLISALMPGIIDVYQDGEITERVFVTGGFAEVHETGCRVLADEAFALPELTADLVQLRLEAAQKALEEAASDAERASAERAMKVVEAIQVIIT